MLLKNVCYASLPAHLWAAAGRAQLTGGIGGAMPERPSAIADGCMGNDCAGGNFVPLNPAALSFTLGFSEDSRQAPGFAPREELAAGGSRLISHRILIAGRT